MSNVGIVFENVWKKFRKGERHNSLRDLMPALAKKAVFGALNGGLADEQEFWALEDVSFKVEPGEALGIIGPNGAGKSTTLKLLTRILKPTRGKCEVRGRTGALIELAAGFHPDLTGRENVFMQGAIMGMKRDEIKRKFDAIVDFAGLAGFIDTPVKRYSSGMNARLGFAVAAHLDPEVLLIDEVLAVGDHTFQQKCYERLYDFRRAGIAIAFVSHNMQAIASLCDKALLLRPHHGPLLGKVGEVLSAYAKPELVQANSRARILSAALSNGNARCVDAATVEPGSRLTVDFEVVTEEDLPRCGIGIVVTRSDGFTVFESISSMEGLADFDVRRGVPMAGRIELQANLLKGTYYVAGYLIDSKRIWPLLHLGTLASFVVMETTRIAGFAELEPTYRLQPTTSLVEPAAVRA